MADDMRDPLEGEETEDEATLEPGSGLLSWVMERVTPWRAFRDQKHKDKWDEYARLWRTESGPSADDSAKPARKSERSKIVTPATMQAVDATVAEIEEAVFGREAWFDIDEDDKESADHEQVMEMVAARDRLLELFEEEDVESEVAKSILCGAVYGTGILKVNVYPKKIRRLYEGQVVEYEESRVEVLNVEPYAFVPDPTTDKIEKMLGCAHETIMPLHEVRQAMRDGRYRATDLGLWSPSGEDPLNENRRLFTYEGQTAEGVKITEWHGLVPAKYLIAYSDPDSFEADLAKGMEEDELLVEAIVTIANEGKVIAAKANPFLMQDRSFLAFQHDTIPGYFWGRGVVEKAYNAQKALDADVRMRIDALALVANPMVAGDITRLPRGMNLAVWPGKFWPTTGAPNEVLSEFKFGNLDPNLFNAAQDMERMIQTATGAMDPGSAYSKADGAQDRALMGSAFIKRARRTMQNIERNLLRPLVRKAMWRYVQYLGTEFPEDYQFTVRGTLGVMAREIEQQQLTQLASLVPQESKPFLAIVKAIFDNSSNSHKKEVLSALDQLLNPPPPSEEEQAQMQKQMELQMRQAEAVVAELEAKADKARGEAERARAQGYSARIEADFRDEELANEQIQHAIDLREVQAFEMQNQISQMMQQLRAFDLAIKAKLAEAQINKTNADAIAIQKGSKAKAD